MIGPLLLFFGLALMIGGAFVGVGNLNKPVPDSWTDLKSALVAMAGVGCIVFGWLMW